MQAHEGETDRLVIETNGEMTCGIESTQMSCRRGVRHQRAQLNNKNVESSRTVNIECSRLSITIFGGTVTDT